MKAKDSKCPKSIVIKGYKKYDGIGFHFNKTVRLLNKGMDTALIHNRNKTCAHVIDSIARVYLSLVEALVREEKHCKPYELKDLDESLPNVEPIKIWQNIRKYYYHPYKATLIQKTDEYQVVKSKKIV
jgi:hypothetical protein